MPSPSPPCRKKRKWAAMAGNQLVSAAAGGIADRALTAALAGYGELKSADEQLEHLEWLVMEIRGAVAEAERVRIRSCSLRRWLQSLRDAAREGGAVARSFRQRRRAEAAAAGGRTGAGRALWWLAVRAAKRALLGDDDMDALSSTLRKVERATVGMGRFLKLIELERAACRSPSPQPVASDDGRLTRGGSVVRLRRCKRTKRLSLPDAPAFATGGVLEEHHHHHCKMESSRGLTAGDALATDRRERSRLRGLVLRIPTAAATAYVITAQCGFGGVFLETFQEDNFDYPFDLGPR